MRCLEPLDLDTNAIPADFLTQCAISRTDPQEPVSDTSVGFRGSQAIFMKQDSDVEVQGLSEDQSDRPGSQLNDSACMPICFWAAQIGQWVAPHGQS